MPRWTARTPRNGVKPRPVLLRDSPDEGDDDETSSGSALIVIGVVLPSVAWAQSATTGAIAGEARDTTGAVLPGVTVEASSPALIEKVRTVVTDDQGRYQIVELRPGPYTVTFSLAGFSTVKREGLELNTGVTLPVSAELRVGSIEETVTVSGASPVVDVQNVRTQNVHGSRGADQKLFWTGCPITLRWARPVAVIASS